MALLFLYYLQVTVNTVLNSSCICTELISTILKNPFTVDSLTHNFYINFYGSYI